MIFGFPGMSQGAVEQEGPRGPSVTGTVYTEANIPVCEGARLSLFCDRCACGFEPEHVHEQLQLSLIFDSAACDYMWCDATGQWHEEHLVGPQFLLIAPRVRHSCRWCQATDAIILYLEAEFRESLLPEGMTSFLASSSLAGASADMVVWQLAATLQRIRGEQEVPDSSLLHNVAVGMAERAIKVLKGALPLGVPGLPKLSGDRIQILDAFIEQHIGSNIGVGDMALKLGLSIAHLTALCRATFRMPPYKYLIRRRMLRALEMLKSGNYRIVEVALAVGFRDQGHFGATFREHFSCTPRSVLVKGYAEPEDSPNKP